MPRTASTVVIRYDGTDITSHVIFMDASFESQMAAMPGAFSLRIKDMEQTLSFVTGKKITVTVDGTLLWAGYLTQVSRTFAIPVDVTAVPANVKTREWVLTGVDYNILFDKLVLRNPSDYTHKFPDLSVSLSFGEALRTVVFPNYIDVPTGLDYTTSIDNVTSFQEFNSGPYGQFLTPEQAAAPWALVQQGSYLRRQMDSFAAFGALYYIDQNFQVHFHSWETIAAPWGFSDRPNKFPLGTGPLTTIGMRDFEVTEDASQVVNEAFVYGGSAYAIDTGGTAGAVVVGHNKNTTSVSEHGLWQYSEYHPDETNYMLQSSVDVRANIIVNGPEIGNSPFDNLTRGLYSPVFQIRCTWFAHDVPSTTHLIPGQVVTFILYTLGSDASHPLILNLPLRSIRISFPGLDSAGKAYVQYEGQFAIQLNDQLWYWKYLRDMAAGNGTSSTVPSPIVIQSDTTVTSVLGQYVQLFPTEIPDGAKKTFSLSQPYIAGSLQVYINGLLQTPGISFAEVDPASGTFEFFFAPASDDIIWATARIGA